MVEWNDVYDGELIGELEERGYYVVSDRNDYSLIEELESRGYYVTKEKMNQVSQDDVFNLYQNYLTLKPESFSIVLRRFFEKYLGVIERNDSV